MEYVSRAEWGARPPKQTVAMRSSQGVAIHHSVTGTSPEKSVMKGIQNYHMDNKGWFDFAYNWAVGASGTIYEGRGWDIADGADTGPGKVLFSVCYLGNEEATPEAKAGINKVIAEHDRRYGKGRVVGHGQINSTSCPGANLQNWINAGRPGSETTEPPVVPAVNSKEKKMFKLKNADGRWEFLAIHPDGRIMTSFEGSPGGFITNWTEFLPGNPKGVALEAHAATTKDDLWQDGRLVLHYADAAYGVLMVSWQNGPGSSWTTPVSVNDLKRLFGVK